MQVPMSLGRPKAPLQLDRGLREQLEIGVPIYAPFLKAKPGVPLTYRPAPSAECLRPSVHFRHSVSFARTLPA